MKEKQTKGGRLRRVQPQQMHREEEAAERKERGREREKPRERREHGGKVENRK